MTSRVVSKHLFNYQLHGVMDDYVLKLQSPMGLQTDEKLKELQAMVESDDPCVDPSVVATLSRFYMNDLSIYKAPHYQQAIDLCTHNEFKVPLRDGNDFEVPVFIHTPRTLSGNESNPAIIHAHGGGCISGNALQSQGMLSYYAIETGVVYFSVDYRLAPETKCPKNALDFYCAVKHIIENAECLGIDASRIAIAGDSGGGYICFATMVMFAEKDESHLIKLSIPSIPMIDDYSFTDPALMTNEERKSAPVMKKTWHCIANHLETDRNNPLLFPAKASDDIIRRMPATIIWEFEFDIFITEATRMAHRMRREGRLLEFRVQPGMTHMSAYISGTEGYRLNMEDYKLAIKEYLL